MIYAYEYNFCVILQHTNTERSFYERKSAHYIYIIYNILYNIRIFYSRIKNLYEYGTTHVRRESIHYTLVYAQKLCNAHIFTTHLSSSFSSSFFLHFFSYYYLFFSSFSSSFFFDVFVSSSPLKISIFLAYILFDPIPLQ